MHLANWVKHLRTVDAGAVNKKSAKIATKSAQGMQDQLLAPNMVHAEDALIK